MDNPLNKKSSSVGATYGLDMLQAHCEKVNALKWVQASGKRYVIVRGDDGKHFLDFRKIPNAQ